MRVDGSTEFKWEGIRHRKRRRLWPLVLLGLLPVPLLTLGFVSGVVFASHNFSDVPTTAFYHDAVEWVKNRAITAGCAAGLYCPNDAVTRGTMAVFLRALGTALTPTYIEAPQLLPSLDPDTNPVICATGDIPVTGYPRTALVNGQIMITPAGPMAIYMVIVYSTDAGATWNSINYYGQNGSSGAAGPLYISLNSYARVDLDVGTTYRLGIRISRIPETTLGDANTTTCELRVAIVNRNGASSPLSPSR